MATKLNQTVSRFVSVNGAMIPNEGPRSIPLTLDFSTDTEFDLDMQNIESRGFISMLQSVFVDNSANASALAIAFPNTGQSLIIGPNKQAYLTVLCPNPSIIVFTSVGGVVVRVQLLNFPVTNFVW